MFLGRLGARLHCGTAFLVALAFGALVSRAPEEGSSAPIFQLQFNRVTLSPPGLFRPNPMAQLIRSTVTLELGKLQHDAVDIEPGKYGLVSRRGGLATSNNSSSCVVIWFYLEAVIDHLVISLQ